MENRPVARLHLPIAPHCHTVRAQVVFCQRAKLRAWPRVLLCHEAFQPGPPGSHLGSHEGMGGVVPADLPVAQFIDLAAEKARLTKEIGGHASDMVHIGKKLNNPDFVARAKEEVVEENRAKLAEAETAKAKLEAALARLVVAG